MDYYNIGFIIPGLTWKTEYRAAWYGSQDNRISCATTAPGFCAPVGPTTEADRSKLWQQSVRTELVWRFGGGAVYAKY